MNRKPGYHGKEAVLEGLAKNILVRHEDGSVWADMRDKGLDEKVLLRSDGTSVYMTQDIGTAKVRQHDYAPDKMVYVVGNEQNYHFKVLVHHSRHAGISMGQNPASPFIWNGGIARRQNEIARRNRGGCR